MEQENSKQVLFQMLIFKFHLKFRPFLLFMLLVFGHKTPRGSRFLEPKIAFWGGGWKRIDLGKMQCIPSFAPCCGDMLSQFVPWWFLWGPSTSMRSKSRGHPCSNFAPKQKLDLRPGQWEDHPRTFKWLMVPWWFVVVPKTWGCVLSPSIHNPWPFIAYQRGGGPNYLRFLGWSSKQGSFWVAIPNLTRFWQGGPRTDRYKILRPL